MKSAGATVAYLVVFLLGINALLLADPAVELPRLHGALRSPYLRSLVVAAFWVVDGWALGTLLLAGLGGRSLADLWRRSWPYNGFCLLAGMLLMLATNPLAAGRWPWLRLAIPLGLLLLAARTLHLAVVAPGAGSPARRWRGPATAAFAVIALFLLLEAAFYFVARPDANDNSLSSKVWFARHWEVNAGGYREDGRCDAPAHGKAVLRLLGDSFTAGHGVADVGDRFSDRLQRLLGDGWEVHNHGQNGAATIDLPAQSRECRAQPQATVVCWYVNDIEGTLSMLPAWPYHALRGARRPPCPVSPLHGSYFLDYLRHYLPADSSALRHQAELRAAYADSAVMADYALELRLVLGMLHSPADGPLGIVLFPALEDVGGSEYALAPMRRILRRLPYPVLDLSPVYAPHSPEALVVNSHDAHPNPFAHALAARAMHRFFGALGWWGE